MTHWTPTVDGEGWCRPDALVTPYRRCWRLWLHGRPVLDETFRPRLWPTAEAAMQYADRRLRESDETTPARPGRMR